MIISAGLVVKYEDKILLVKQKGRNERSFSIPKGMCDGNESILDTAIRETEEETGLKIYPSEVTQGPFVLHYYSHQKQTVWKRIYYYIIELKDYPLNLNLTDHFEIESVGMYTYEEAQKLIFIQQLPILFHYNRGYINVELFNWLVSNGFVSKEKHPTANIFIYNYTDKTKETGYWNECTLWARGLIADKEGKIIAYPMKKFFEYGQLLPVFKDIKVNFKVYDKIDGCLGILYWFDGLPYITTRISFVAHQSYKATMMLYSKYFENLEYLNPDLTYYFEIVYPEKRIVLDYGKTDELFLLGAYDNRHNCDIDLDDLDDLSFPKVKRICTNSSFGELLKQDDGISEGYVVKLSDGTRIKIKFQSFKDKYNNIYNKL